MISARLATTVLVHLRGNRIATTSRSSPSTPSLISKAIPENANSKPPWKDTFWLKQNGWAATNARRESRKKSGPQTTSASNLIRDRGARASLPQNCSLAKIKATQDFANSTPVLVDCPKVPSLTSCHLRRRPQRRRWQDVASYVSTTRRQFAHPALAPLQLASFFADG